MVPNGWTLQHLSDLTSKISDGIHATPKYAEKSSIYFINGNNIKNGKIIIQESTKFVDEEDAKNHSRELTDRTILMSINGTIGNCAFYRGESVVLGKSACYINVNKNIDLEFVFYVLSDSRTQRLYESELTGSTIRNLSLKTIKTTKVLTPTLPEQKKISKILSTWDQAITTIEQMLESSQQQKKALMQQLLTGRKRLNGFQRAWGNLRLEQLFSRVTTKNTEVNTNVVTISAQHGLIRQEDFFNKTVASEILDNYFLLKKGQFAYNKSYSNGYPMGAIKRLKKYEKGVVTTLYICFEANNKSICNPEFFEHYFESGLLNNGLSKIANEGGRAHGLLNVKPSDFFRLTVFIPEVAEQKAISAVLNTADQEIQTLQTKLSSLRDEKKALTQQLLTGKRRVKIDQLEVV